MTLLDDAIRDEPIKNPTMCILVQCTICGTGILCNLGRVWERKERHADLCHPEQETAFLCFHEFVLRKGRV